MYIIAEYVIIQVVDDLVRGYHQVKLNNSQSLHLVRGYHQVKLNNSQLMKRGCRISDIKLSLAIALFFLFEIHNLHIIVD